MKTTSKGPSGAGARTSHVVGDAAARATQGPGASTDAGGDGGDWLGGMTGTGKGNPASGPAADPPVGAPVDTSAGRTQRQGGATESKRGQRT